MILKLGRKPSLDSKNLIVRLWNKLCIYFPEIFFGMDDFPKIEFSGSKLHLIFGSALNGGVNINQFTDHPAEFFVEID